MHRVLSFQMGMAPPRGFGEPGEFVTKRMCFSFIFFISFLALLGGFLLGRFSTERNMELREKRKELELAKNANDGVATGSADLLYSDLLSEELQKEFPTPSQILKTSENKTLDVIDSADLHTVKIVLSSLLLFTNVVEKKTSVVATLRGSYEPDRWVVLSLSGDGTKLGLQLARIFDKLRLNHDWKPQRTIIFCFFNDPRDSCGDHFSEYSKSRIVAYLAVHGKAIKRNACFVTSGSEIVRSVVSQEFIQVRDASEDLRRDLIDCKSEEIVGQIFRLASDLPHAFVSFYSKNSNSTNTSELQNEAELQLYRRTLSQIIGLSVLKFSDTVIFHWEPRDFERSVKTSLEMINSSHFNDVKDQISSTVRELVISAESFITDVEKPSQLGIRMTNDLLMDLDRALLCADADFESKTDPASIPRLLTQSENSISTFLSNMLKCYKDAVEVLREG